MIWAESSGSRHTDTAYPKENIIWMGLRGNLNRLDIDWEKNKVTQLPQDSKARVPGPR